MQTVVLLVPSLFITPNTMIKEYALIKNNSSKSIRIESNKLLKIFLFN